MEKSEDKTNTDNNAYNSIRDDTIEVNIYAPNSSCKGIGNWTQKTSPLPCSKTDFTRIIRRKGMYLKKVPHRCISHSIPDITHFSQADTTALSSGLVLRMALHPVSCSWSPSPLPPPPPPPAAPAPPPCSASMSSTWCCGWCCGKIL